MNKERANRSFFKVKIKFTEKKHLQPFIFAAHGYYCLDDCIFSISSNCFPIFSAK